MDTKTWWIFMASLCSLANGVVQMSAKTNPLIFVGNGKYEYSFIDGEETTFSCTKLNRNTNYILQWDVNIDKLFQVLSRNKSEDGDIEVELHLHGRNNGQQLNCQYTREHNTNTVSTKFIMTTVLPHYSLSSTPAPTGITMQSTPSVKDPGKLPEKNKKFIELLADENRLQCTGAPPRFDCLYTFFNGEEFIFIYNLTFGAKMWCWNHIEGRNDHYIINEDYSNTDKNVTKHYKIVLTKLDNTRTISCSYHQTNENKEDISIHYFLENTKHPPFNPNTIQNTTIIKNTTEDSESTVKSKSTPPYISGSYSESDQPPITKVWRDSSTIVFSHYPLKLNLTCYKVKDGPSESLSWFIDDQKNETKSMDVKMVKDYNVSVVLTINHEDDIKAIKCQFKGKPSPRLPAFTKEIELKLAYHPPPTEAATSPSTGAEKSDPNQYLTKFKRFKRGVQELINKFEGLDAQSGAITDDILMELQFKSSEYSCSSNHFNVITAGNTLQIKINAAKAISHHWCEINESIINFTKIYTEPGPDNRKQYTHTIPNVTKEMDGTWNCTFLGYLGPLSHWRPKYKFNNKIYLKANCIFNVTVRAPPPVTTTSTSTTTTTTTTTTTITISSTLSTITTTSTSPMSTASSTTSTTPNGKSTSNSTTDVTSKATEETEKEHLTRSGKCFGKCKVATTTEKNKTKPKKNSLTKKRTTKSPWRSKTSKPTTKATSTTQKPKSTTLAEKYYSIEEAEPITSSPSATTPTTSYPLGNKTENSEKIKTTEDSGTAGFPTTLVWWGVAGAAVLIILIIVIVYACRTCQHAKAEQNHTDHLDYENLTSEHSSQFPPNLEDAYASPYDNRSLEQESPYAVSSYQQNSETYSVPYTETDVSKLYAKPVPKNQRQNLLYSKVLPKSQRKEQGYAQVLPKGQRVKVLPERKNPTEVTYAEIETTPSKGRALSKIEPTYSEVAGYANKSSSYDNVISDRSRYANTNETEYAEPAYCELQR